MHHNSGGDLRHGRPDRLESGRINASANVVVEAVQFLESSGLQVWDAEAFRSRGNYPVAKYISSGESHR